MLVLHEVLQINETTNVQQDPKGEIDQAKVPGDGVYSFRNLYAFFSCLGVESLVNAIHLEHNYIVNHI